jgi:hypothetical protein
MTHARRTFHKILLATAATLTLGTVSGLAGAASAEDLNRDAEQALQTLYKSNSSAEALSRKGACRAGVFRRSSRPAWCLAAATVKGY